MFHAANFSLRRVYVLLKEGFGILGDRDRRKRTHEILGMLLRDCWDRNIKIRPKKARDQGVWEYGQLWGDIRTAGEIKRNTSSPGTNPGTQTTGFTQAAIRTSFGKIPVASSRVQPATFSNLKARPWMAKWLCIMPMLHRATRTSLGVFQPKR